MFRNIQIWLLAIFSLSLVGCAQDLERINKDLRAFNEAMAKNTGVPVAASANQKTALAVETPQKQQTQLVVPQDKAVEAAMDAAMPNIKKVISMHRCMKDHASMRLLNFHSVPGNDMGSSIWGFPSSNMQYHNKNTCLEARKIDDWNMPALNALRFRVVYFAVDSGESTNYAYEFKRVEDDSWKLNGFSRH